MTSNSICPVYVRTPLVESQIADQARAHNISEDEVVERIMLIEPAIKRLVEPEEITELAHFLCTPRRRLSPAPSLPWTAGRPRTNTSRPFV